MPRNKRFLNFDDLARHFSQDIYSSLKWRAELRRKCQISGKLRKAVVHACRDSPIFFFRAFCYLYEPRPRRDPHGRQMPMTVPFLTWPHQDDAINTLAKCLGYCDAGVEKSRGEGASWICALLALRDWIFFPMSSIGIVSKDKDSANNPDNPDSIMWKLYWEAKKLPQWMVGAEGRDWERSVTKASLINYRNNSTISAYAATGDVASGGRKKFFVMDELAKFPRSADKAAMASTQHVTDSRIIVSTPKGATGEYYRLMHEPSNMKKIVLAWEDNPTRNRGMYRLVGGIPIAADSKNNPLFPEYDPPSQEVLDMYGRLRTKGFRLDGCARSPWFDNECDRARATPQSIAQELSRDYGGSQANVFGIEFDDVVRETVQDPYVRGEIIEDADGDAMFVTKADGPVKLWVTLIDGKPMPGRYAIGCDVASGLGGHYSSNSVIEVVRTDNGNQVFEFASNTLYPEDFAKKAVLVAKWFYNAYLVWEHSGPGCAMTNYVVKVSGYHNIYHQEKAAEFGRKKIRTVGWIPREASKEVMINNLIADTRCGALVIRSRMVADEAKTYIRNEEGKITNALIRDQEGQNSGAAHGDRVVAIGLANLGMRDRPVTKGKKRHEVNHGDPLPGSIAYRELIRNANAEKINNPWDSTTTADLADTHWSPYIGSI